MIIKCYRCSKEIDTPDKHNADYIIASDTIVREPREIFIALKHNQATKAKVVKIKKDKVLEEGDTPTLDFIRSKFQDSEYDKVEVPSVKSAQETIGKDLIKIVAEIREKDIQKTGVICPDCYKPDDTVIWGIHKE